MNENSELKRFGGWLVLVGIGVMIAPFRLAIMSFSTYKPIFEDGTWEALTSVDSEAYNPLWAPLLIGEIGFNICMFLLSVYLVYLFFSKHYLFPKTFIATVFILVVFIPLDAWLVSFALPGEPMFDDGTIREFMRTFIGGVIWVPYMLISKRVRVIFVEKKPNKSVNSQP